MIFKSAQFGIFVLNSLPSDELQWKRAPSLPQMQPKSSEKSKPLTNFRRNTLSYKNESHVFQTPIDSELGDKELNSVEIQSDTSSSNNEIGI